MTVAVSSAGESGGACDMREGAVIRADEVVQLAAETHAALQALVPWNAPNERALRRKYSGRLRAAEPLFVLDLALELVERYGQRSFPYELVERHQGAYRRLDETLVESLGQGINSWWSVDSFARTVAGPAWRDGLVEDEVILRWAHSADRWWRRAALVSTVAWNVRSKGGPGDVTRTLAVCRLLAADRDDIVAKALSWALRELVIHDREAVRLFLLEHEAVLAARVKREVRNKLETGRKNPTGQRARRQRGR